MTTVFTDESFYLIPGITNLILLIITSIVLSICVYISMKSERNISYLSLIGGIILFLVPIIFLVSVAVTFPAFYEYNYINAGMIIPFIAGFFGIFAFIINKKEKK